MFYENTHFIINQFRSIFKCWIAGRLWRFVRGTVETTKVEDMAAETDSTEMQDIKSVPWSEWEQDEYGWRYRAGENHITNRWLERDGQFCYMGEDGYMLTDTITPDGVCGLRVIFV